MTLSKELKGDLNPEQKKTTNMTTSARSQTFTVRLQPFAKKKKKKNEKEVTNVVSFGGHGGTPAKSIHSS